MSLHLFFDDFERTVLFNLEAQSELAKEGIFMSNGAVVDMVILKEMQSSDSNIGDAEGGDVAIECFVDLQSFCSCRP